MLTDIRNPSDRGFHISVNFDIFTNPLRLTPYRTSEANEDKALDIVRFTTSYDGSATQIFGLGVVSGTSRVKIFQKTGANIAARITGDWTASTSGEQTGGTARNENVLFAYKGYLYGWRDGNILWRWGDFTSTPSFTDTYQTVTAFTDVAPPVLHPADDIAYFFTDNIVHSLNGASWTAGVLTLPSNLIITDAEPVGNLLAIACKPKAVGGKSVVFLWDRDSTLTTITDKIDWGEGDLLYIGYIDGRLVGVTNYYTSNSTVSVTKGKLIIKVAVGQKAVTVNEIEQVDTTVSVGIRTIEAIANSKNIKDNKMHFTASMTDDVQTYRGTMVVDGNGRLTFDYVEDEAKTTSLQSMYLVGNNWFIAHSDDGSVNRTNDSAIYTTISVYQSQLRNGGDSSLTKKLKSVTIVTPPLKNSGQVVLKYRKDEETSFTTILTHSTANAIRNSAVNIVSTGAALPQYKEIQFRLESTNGAEITGLLSESEVIDDDIN